MTLLFIYGTLKRGCCRHAALTGQRFLGEVQTAPQYQMVDLGEYPGLIDAPNRGYTPRPISGELWEVDELCLRRLDAIEGVDEQLYERRIIKLIDSPLAGDVESYFYLQATAGCPDCGTAWTDKR